MDRRPDYPGLRTPPSDDLAPRQPRLGEFEFGDHLLHDLGDRSSSNQERPDDRDPGRQGEAVPRPARGARRVCHRQCVGWRFGPDDGSAGLRGAGDLERRIRGFARSARRPGHPRGGLGAGEGDLPGHRSAGLRGPRKGFRRRAGSRRGNHQARRCGGTVGGSIEDASGNRTRRSSSWAMRGSASLPPPQQRGPCRFHSR